MCDQLEILLLNEEQSKSLRTRKLSSQHHSLSFLETLKDAFALKCMWSRSELNIPVKSNRQPRLKAAAAACGPYDEYGHPVPAESYRHDFLYMYLSREVRTSLDVDGNQSSRSWWSFVSRKSR